MGRPRSPENEETRELFLEWLLTPKSERDPATQTEFAELYGLHPATVAGWKRSPEFLERWNTEYLRTVGSPETKGEIMATLRRTATDQDDPKHVSAAKTYFEIEGSLRPAKQQVDVQVTARAVSDLSDADLQRLLAAKADDELARRRDAG